MDASDRRGGRDFARACLDWSERRHHLAGELVSLSLSRFLELKWIATIAGMRAIRITERGHQAFRDAFGLKIEGAARRRC
jgi:hypothetical protein